MASGAFVIPDLAKLNLVNATDLMGATLTNFRLALVTSSWTPANSTDELWSVASANEIANGNGYTTGGASLPSLAISQTSGTVKFTSSPVVWNATGTGIPAWRRGVIYYLGTLNGKVNPILAHFLGDSTPADVPLTTSSNSLTITMNASGIVSLT